MKKCRRCSKPATLHITEIRKGEVQQLHLCEICAQKYLAQPNPDADDEPLSSEPGDAELEGVDARACPHCGTTFRQFRSTGRLGCPHDYQVFEAELASLLENIHDGTQHCGKFPRQTGAATQEQFRLIKLKNELKSAVEQEDYEKAAKIRDEIQLVEKKHPAGPAE